MCGVGLVRSRPFFFRGYFCSSLDPHARPLKFPWDGREQRRDENRRRTRELEVRGGGAGAQTGRHNADGAISAIMTRVQVESIPVM